MTDFPTEDAPDPELADLVARFLDDRLDAGQRDRLDQRLKEDPAARDYCATRLRFAAALRETLEPQRLEWLETRRIVIEPGESGPEWSVEQQRSVRHGSRRPISDPGLPRPGRVVWRRWVILLMAVGVGAVAWLAWMQFHPASRTAAAVPALVLRNGNFEATDLSLSPRGFGISLVAWQDVFSCPEADLCDIGRVSNGRIFAKSGRNVARLKPGGYLTQQLRRTDGSALGARPGLKVRVSGWVFNDGAAQQRLKCSLRVIASGRPDTIQYEACTVEHRLEASGWQPFLVDLQIAGDLMKTPYWVEKTVDHRPALDLTGRDLYLSIDSGSWPADLLFDDVTIKEIPK